MSYTKSPDHCLQGKVDCFAFGTFGKCRACINTRFNGPCPFYKTTAQRRKEHTRTVERLKQMNRSDLIYKYGEEKRQLKLWEEI